MKTNFRTPKKIDDFLFLLAVIWWVFVLFISCITIFTGCTTKKTQVKVDDLEKRVETLHAYVISQTSQSIDTTKRVNTNIATETVQFFNPNEINDYERYLALVQAQDLLYGNAGLVKSITKLEDKTSLIQSGIISIQSIIKPFFQKIDFCKDEYRLI